MENQDTYLNQIKELLESKGLKEEDTENKYFWTGNSLSIW